MHGVGWVHWQKHSYANQRCVHLLNCVYAPHAGFVRKVPQVSERDLKHVEDYVSHNMKPNFLPNSKKGCLDWHHCMILYSAFVIIISSISCGADDHKIFPCTTIISKCGNLLFLHCSFIIPKQSLYIIKVWNTWSTRSPFANGWNVQSISSSTRH